MPTAEHNHRAISPAPLIGATPVDLHGQEGCDDIPKTVVKNEPLRVIRQSEIHRATNPAMAPITIRPKCLHAAPSQQIPPWRQPPPPLRSQLYRTTASRQSEGLFAAPYRHLDVTQEGSMELGGCSAGSANRSHRSGCCHDCSEACFCITCRRRFFSLKAFPSCRATASTDTPAFTARSGRLC